MARPRAAAAPLLLASLAGRTAAYPEFWASVSLGDFGSLRPGGDFGRMGIRRFEASVSLGDFGSLRPGGDFGRMGIRRFEAHAPGACALSSNAPADGFDPEANYTITVSSDAEGGVGHISRASAGGFAEALLAPGVVFTRGVETSAEKTWTWSSPSADAASVAFYAVCATGYHGKAFVAQPLVLQRKGGALPACAGASDRSALAAPCRCGTSGPAFPACEAGQCCWTDFRCRPCSEPGPPPDVQPSVAIWLHALLMLGSWGALLPLGVLFARHRSEARDWFPWHRGLQSAGCLCQAAGAAAAVWHVQLQGAGHFSGPHWLHMRLGLAVAVAAVFQVLSAALRPPKAAAAAGAAPEPEPSPRARWARAHRALGYGLLLAAAVTVGSGLAAACGAFGFGRLAAACVAAACLLLGALLAAAWRLRARTGPPQRLLTARSR